MGQLAQMLRAKYPGAYDDLDDATLEAQTVAKYPEYADLAEPKEAAPAWDLTGPVKPAMIGMAKSAAQGAINAGRLIHKIPGVSEGVDALYNLFGVKVDSGRDFGEGDAPMSAEQRFGADFKSTTEKVGGAIEQGLEMFAGGGPIRGAASKMISRGPRLIPNIVADAVAGAVSSAAHNEDPTTGAAINAAVPVGGALAGRAASGAKNTAVRLVRAAIKPTVTEMKQTAGASRVGIDNIANRLSKFLIDNRITTPDKAQAIINSAEAEIQSLVGNQATDAATRAERYLHALEQSAAKQALGADDVATIRGAAQQLLDGPMGETVPTLIPVQGGYTLGTTRAARATVPADEALTSARASGRWSTRRAWGEQKGAATEAGKAVERAQRDAVKAAVPETRPQFAAQSQAIKARDVLRRADFRQGNRDVVGLASQGIGAAEMLKGKPPILAMAAGWLRNNQLKAGMWADSLGNAIKNDDVQTVAEILARLGVSLADQPEE